MSQLMQDLASGFGGLVAWVAILAAIVGIALLMRHFSVAGRVPELRRTVLIVALASGILVLAGVGGVALMHGATAG